MKSARVAVGTAALLLATLAGCGGDEEASTSSLGEDEQTAADNLASQIVRSGSMSGQGTGEGAVTEAQAGCIAEGAVAEVGLGSLQDYGIVTEDLLVNKSIQGVEMEAADADALAGVFVACIDAEALFEKRFLAGLRADTPKKGRPGPQAQRCVEKAVGVGAVEKILSASFQGRSTRAYGKLERKVAACAKGRRGGR